MGMNLERERERERDSLFFKVNDHLAVFFICIYPFPKESCS